MSNKKRSQIILPSINICDILNDCVLGVLIGVFTGIAIEILINQGTISYWLFFASAFFLCIAICENQRFNDFCKSCIINKQDLHGQTNQEIKKYVISNVSEAPKIIKCFNWSIILAALSIVFGIYFYKNQQSDKNTQLHINEYNYLFDSIKTLNEKIDQQNEIIERYFLNQKQDSIASPKITNKLK